MHAGGRKNSPFVDEALKRRSVTGILETCVPHLEEFSVADFVKVFQALLKVPDVGDRALLLQPIAAHAVREVSREVGAKPQ
jgi:hypothetical protein